MSFADLVQMAKEDPSTSQVSLKVITETMLKYFHLQASYGCSINIYATEVLFWFESELFGTQPRWFTLHQ